MFDFYEMFPNYDVTSDGIIYKNGCELKPFKSNKYLQVLLFDINHKRHVFGVHTVVAMRFLTDWYKGCVVHHIDGNTHNNNVTNLMVESRSEHSKHHMSGNRTLANYTKEHGPYNKGKIMPESYRECRRISARKRVKRYGFFGNQYVDRFGNRKD